jgi:hypothetical protein
MVKLLPLVKPTVRHDTTLALGGSGRSSQPQRHRCSLHGLLESEGSNPPSPRSAGRGPAREGPATWRFFVPRVTACARREPPGTDAARTQRGPRTALGQGLEQLRQRRHHDLTEQRAAAFQVRVRPGDKLDGVGEDLVVAGVG